MKTAKHLSIATKPFQFSFLFTHTLKLLIQIPHQKTGLVNWPVKPWVTGAGQRQRSNISAKLPAKSILNQVYEPTNHLGSYYLRGKYQI